jgi:chemotaxis protein CheD
MSAGLAINIAREAVTKESKYLLPGEIYFGNGKELSELKTLLGSCVAIILWHPHKHLVGMCHITLPGNANDTDTKYASGAMKYFLEQISKHGTRPDEYIVGVYGGGKMVSVDDPPSMLDIGNRNAQATLALIGEHNFRLKDMDLLDSKYRHVCINPEDGSITVKATDVSQTMG